MCYLMDPDTDVYQTEQPQISYSFDFTAEQSRAIQSPNLLGREDTQLYVHVWTTSSSIKDNTAEYIWLCP